MERERNDADVLVVGGGPAGLMAAIAAARAGARVLLLEKGQRLARKLLLSGGGRCNVTNRKPYDELIRHIPANGRFLYSALHQFGPEAIIAFFAELGLQLKEEDDNRMFPVTDRAADVAEALLHHLRQLRVAIRTGAPVARLTFAGGRCTGAVLAGGQAMAAGAVVVAVGGCSVPQTGSTGDGYAWAREAGHTITPLYPAEVPLLASDPWVASRALQGVALRGVVQTLYGPEGQRLSVQRGDMIFTHFGISGPATLRTSHYVSQAHLRWGPVPLHLAVDLFPHRPLEDLARDLLALAAAEPRRQVHNLLRPLTPDRMAPLVVAQAGVNPATTGAHLSRAQAAALARCLKAWPVTVTGTLPLAQAFVTGGGVCVKEVDPRTMASRKVQGLYFAGEILDVHGHTGGYNITVAFATGWAAGRAAAAAARGGG